MKSKQKQFLQQLGYTIEDVTYTVWHDGNRRSEDWETQHEVSLAYKKETDKIIEFKEREYHTHTVESHYYVSDCILERVYKRELEDTLYEMALNYVTKKNLMDTFSGVIE